MHLTDSISCTNAVTITNGAKFDGNGFSIRFDKPPTSGDFVGDSVIKVEDGAELKNVAVIPNGATIAKAHLFHAISFGEGHANIQNVKIEFPPGGPSSSCFSIADTTTKVVNVDHVDCVGFMTVGMLVNIMSTTTALLEEVNVSHATFTPSSSSPSASAAIYIGEAPKMTNFNIEHLHAKGSPSKRLAAGIWTQKIRSSDEIGRLSVNHSTIEYTAGSAVQIQNAVGQLSITNTNIYSSNGDGISVDQKSRDMILANLFVKDIVRNAIKVMGGNKIRILDSKFLGVANNSASDGIGILHCDDLKIENILVSTVARGIHVQPYSTIETKTELKNVVALKSGGGGNDPAISIDISQWGRPEEYNDIVKLDNVISCHPGGHETSQAKVEFTHTIGHEDHLDIEIKGDFVADECGYLQRDSNLNVIGNVACPKTPEPCAGHCSN